MTIFVCNWYRLYLLLTWEDANSKPDDIPPDTGKVISVANSKATGKYPAIKNLNLKRFKAIQMYQVYEYIVRRNSLLVTINSNQ